MKRFLLFFLISGAGAVALYAQSFDMLWANANEEYAQGQYQEAFDQYKYIYNRGYESASLYYNMGNCAFKMELYAQSILWFERAKLFDPKNPDVLYNVEIVNRFFVDKIETVPHFFMRSWIINVRDGFTSNEWAQVFLALLVVTLALLLLFFYGRSRSGRRWAFYGALIVFILMISVFFFGWSQKQQLQRHDHAIVMAPVVTVKSAPDRQGKDLFIIHEGLKIRFIDQVGGWGRIELADGRQGWIEVGFAERI
ncbi:MAG: hypothetical protein LBC84_04990 [Prevotellaceae bacterium]|jgi:tetratricopeptide (TPR) repeat protein|nr:hypothetical protein [Prevotellaceae bacterium]